MKKVIANCTFRPSDAIEAVKAGQEIHGSAEYKQELIRGGLAREVAVRCAPPRQKRADS